MKYSLVLEKSKSSHIIPKVNDVYLHSSLDPIKEAQTFAQVQMARLTENSKILILGLGFGYHIQAIAQCYYEKFKTHAEILVIEPCRELVDAYQLNSNNKLNFSIITSTDIEEVFRDEKLISHLSSKPIIVSHSNSFNLSKAFFAGFLSFRTGKEIGTFFQHLNNKAQKSLESVDMQMNIDEYLDELSNKRDLSQGQQLLLAFKKMTQSQVVDNAK